MSKDSLTKPILVGLAAGLAVTSLIIAIIVQLVVVFYIGMGAWDYVHSFGCSRAKGQSHMYDIGCKISERVFE